MQRTSQRTSRRDRPITSSRPTTPPSRATHIDQHTHLRLHQHQLQPTSLATLSLPRRRTSPRARRTLRTIRPLSRVNLPLSRRWNLLLSQPLRVSRLLSRLSSLRTIPPRLLQPSQRARQMLHITRPMSLHKSHRHKNRAFRTKRQDQQPLPLPRHQQWYRRLAPQLINPLRQARHTSPSDQWTWKILKRKRWRKRRAVEVPRERVETCGKVAKARARARARVKAARSIGSGTSVSVYR